MHMHITLKRHLIFFARQNSFSFVLTLDLFVSRVCQIVTADCSRLVHNKIMRKGNKLLVPGCRPGSRYKPYFFNFLEF